jgi:TPR repeat protein
MAALYVGCGREEVIRSESAETTAETDEKEEGSSKSPAQGTTLEEPIGQCTGPESCYASGKASLGRGDHARARGLFEKACTGGHGTACFRLGAMCRDGRGFEANQAEARSWFERACAAGSTRGCDALGH